MDYKVIQTDDFILELSLDVMGTAYYYKVYNKNKDYIGQCGIRFEKNEKNYYLGNIEYEVFPEYRGNGYASSLTKILGNIALDKGIDSLIITANPKNIASIKTIESLGANFIEIVKVPKKSRLFKNKNNKVCVYEWDIEESRKQK